MRFMFIGALLLGAHKSWESLRFCVATHLRRGQNIRVRACSWKPVSVMCRMRIICDYRQSSMQVH
jgi:hypothetical protein